MPHKKGLSSILGSLFFVMFLFVSHNISLCNNATQGEGKQEKIPVSPLEDLMREHGALNRILAIYKEIADRLERGDCLFINVLEEAAHIVRYFIEDYHEKLEEEYIFPVFEKAHKFESMVKTLRAQHQAGRMMTDQILKRSRDLESCDPDQRSGLAVLINLFIRMYRPHETRESTELFPAFHTLVSQEVFNRLGDIFEDREQELFGDHGFENVIKHIIRLEKMLGINDLSKFTPTRQEIVTDIFQALRQQSVFIYREYTIRMG